MPDAGGVVLEKWNSAAIPRRIAQLDAEWPPPGTFSRYCFPNCSSASPAHVNPSRRQSPRTANCRRWPRWRGHPRHSMGNWWFRSASGICVSMPGQSRRASRGRAEVRRRPGRHWRAGSRGRRRVRCADRERWEIFLPSQDSKYLSRTACGARRTLRRSTSTAAEANTTKRRLWQPKIHLFLGEYLGYRPGRMLHQQV